MRRRYDEIPLPVELLFDAIGGTVVMLLAVTLFDMPWGWAALLGYGGVAGLLFVITHEADWGSSGAHRNDDGGWLHDFLNRLFD